MCPIPAWTSKSDPVLLVFPAFLEALQGLFVGLMQCLKNSPSGEGTAL